MPQLDIATYPSQLFWLCVCFFSTYFIMAKIILPRIADIIEQRRQKIDNCLDKAAKIKAQAEESLEKYQAALAKATSDAEKSLSRTYDELNKLIKEKQDELDKKLKDKIAESEIEIRRNKEKALSEVRHISEALATEIVKKIGLAEISAQDIKNAVKKVK